MDVLGPSCTSDEARRAASRDTGRRPPRRCGGTASRLIQFGMVGAVGTVVNTVVFAAAIEGGVPHLIAAFVSTQIATGFNFAVSERTVFAGRARGRRCARLVSFFALAAAGFTVTGPLMLALIAVRVAPVMANVLAIGALMLVRFLISDRLIWPSHRRSEIAGG